jgi:hypothetical protein
MTVGKAEQSIEGGRERMPGACRPAVLRQDGAGGIAGEQMGGGVKVLDLATYRGRQFGGIVEQGELQAG